MQCHACEAPLAEGNAQCPACGATVRGPEAAEVVACDSAAAAGEVTPSALDLPRRLGSDASRMGIPRGLTVRPPSAGGAQQKMPTLTLLAVIAAVLMLLILAWLSTQTSPP